MTRRRPNNSEKHAYNKLLQKMVALPSGIWTDLPPLLEKRFAELLKDLSYLDTPLYSYDRQYILENRTLVLPSRNSKMVLTPMPFST